MVLHGDITDQVDFQVGGYYTRMAFIMITFLKILHGVQQLQPIRLKAVGMKTVKVLLWLPTKTYLLDFIFQYRMWTIHDNMLQSKNMIINIVNGMTKVMLVNIVCEG